MERKKEKKNHLANNLGLVDSMPEKPDGEISFFNHANEMCQFNGRIKQKHRTLRK